MWAFRLAHSSCVMQRRSSWQFSRAAALGRVDRLVDREDDVGDRHRVGGARQAVAAARAAHAFDQPVPAQLAEQLLEVGQRDLLALADAGQRDRALGAVHRDVDHRRDGESSFGSESHGRSTVDAVRWPVVTGHCLDSEFY